MMTRPGPSTKKILNVNAKKYGFAGEVPGTSKAGSARRKAPEGATAVLKHKAYNYLNTSDSMNEQDSKNYQKGGRGGK